MFPTSAPLPVYFDAGAPLQGGSLYFGTAYGNPKTSPVTVYWDEAGTQPAVQPISVQNGMAYRNGTPAQIYVGTDYSLSIYNKIGALVYYAPSASNAAGLFGGTVSASALSESQTASEGQTLFSLTTMSYTTNALWVFVDGLLVPPSDYTQTSSSSFTFRNGLKAGQTVTAYTSAFSTFGSGKVSATDSNAASADVGSYQFRRNVNYAGGTPGNVNACVRADTYVNNPGAAAFEWAGVFVMHNAATGGENVGMYAQGNKLLGAGPTWGAVAEVIDYSGGNPASGSVGLEVDITGDNGDSSNNRIGIDIVARRTTGSAAASMTAGYGLRFQNGGDTSASFGSLIYVAPGTKAGFGVDLSGASLLAGALKMQQSVPIIFDATATPTKLVSQGQGLDHMQDTTLVNRLLASGGLQVGSVQVVGQRQTGYTPMTGAMDNHSTFDVSTVTLSQLASRVAALQYHLTVHGLIGA
jgi:hypothetical protein